MSQHGRVLDRNWLVDAVAKGRQEKEVSKTVQYLNQDLVRLKSHGEVHQLNFPNAKVDFEQIDWPDRITIHKDGKSGKLKVTIKPDPGEPFISFPIANDFYYSGSSILKDLENLAQQYNLSFLICPEIFPFISFQNIEEYDIPLSELTPRIKQVFGKYETSIAERFFQAIPKLAGIVYEKINIGSLLMGRYYSLGEFLPNKEVRYYNLTVSEENKLPEYRFKNEKEYSRIGQLLTSLQEGQRNIKVRQMERQAIEEKIEKVSQEIENIESSLLGERITSQRKTSEYRRIRSNMTDPDDKVDATIEYLDSLQREKHQRMLEEVEKKNEELIALYVDLEENEQEMVKLSSANNETQENYDSLVVKLNVLEAKYEENAKNG